LKNRQNNGCQETKGIKSYGCCALLSGGNTQIELGSLSCRDKVQNLRRPCSLEFMVLGEEKEEEMRETEKDRDREKAPDIYSVLFKFLLRIDKYMCIMKLPKARARTTRKE
jgi:hypothetical protein